MLAHMRERIALWLGIVVLGVELGAMILFTLQPPL
jgi:hypothetical protein